MLIFLLILTLALPSSAAELFSLPAPGVMVNPGAAVRPALFRGIKVDGQDPFRFQFLVEEGQSALTDEEANRNLRYFFTALTVPEKEVWVNLSPLESNRIVPDVLADTEMGRDLLGQDYVLKQLSSSLLYPEEGLGKEFWRRVYARAENALGTLDVPMDSVNRVWITPGEIEVQERGGVAVIVKATLKVMTEDDYLSRDGQASGAVTPEKNLMTQVFREIVIPELEREVNSGEHFIQVRQVYNALILAAWYKRRFKDGTLSKGYVDRGKTSGIVLADKTIRAAIYERYLEAYKKGVFNYVREETDAAGEVLPRKYFSGGLDLGPQMGPALNFRPMEKSLPSMQGSLDLLDVGASRSGTSEAAQKVEDFITDKPAEAGNKGRNLLETDEILSKLRESLPDEEKKFFAEIPPFKILSGYLYQANKKGDVSLEEVAAALIARFPESLRNGPFAVRSAGAINMPGLLSTVKGVTSVEGIVNAIKKIYADWEAKDARDYLTTPTAVFDINELGLRGFPSDIGPSIVVQQEVFGDKGPESASGVFVSRNPDTGDFILSGTLGLQTPPEDIRNGSDRPMMAISHAVNDQFSSFNGGLYQVLERLAQAFERHYNYPVEVEFIVDNGRLFVVQVNKQDIPEDLQMMTLTKMADDGDISRTAIPLAIQRRIRKVGKIIEGSRFSEISKISTGLSAGAVDGVLAFSPQDVARFRAQGKGPVIMVSDDNNQKGLQQLVVGGDIGGLVTLYGDYHMHLARIARQGLIPGVSLVGSGAQIKKIGRGKILQINGHQYRTGDRLAISSESHIKDSQKNDKEMVHSGIIVEPQQEETIVETKEVVIPDLYFDSPKLQEEIQQRYRNTDPMVLTAVHAILKAFLFKNIVKGKEANKLESATNALHLIFDEPHFVSLHKGEREGEFVPIIEGFGKDFAFPDIRTVDDFPRVFEQMERLVAQYKEMPPALIMYSNYPAGREVVVPAASTYPIEYSVIFSPGRRVDWRKGNPALWRYVQQTKSRIYLKNNLTSKDLGVPGPQVENENFVVDPMDPEKIRVKGYAAILGNSPENIFGLSVSGSFGRKDLTADEIGETPAVTLLKANNFSDYILNVAAQSRVRYRSREEGKPVVNGNGNGIGERVIKSFLPQGGLKPWVIIQSKSDFFQPEFASQSKKDVVGPNDFVWRWFDQQLGFEDSQISEQRMRVAFSHQNQNWTKESVVLKKILDRVLNTEGKGISVRSGWFQQDAYSLHNQRVIWYLSYLSMMVIGREEASALAAAIKKLSKKYDLSPMVTIDDRGRETVDLEGVVFLLYFEQGGTPEELQKLSQDASQVGGIDLDISGRSLGNDALSGDRRNGSPVLAADSIKGLAPVIIKQTPDVSLADFVGP